MICVNNELADFGFKSTLSPDKTMIYIDDSVKDQICNFLSEKKHISPFQKTKWIACLRFLMLLKNRKLLLFGSKKALEVLITYYLSKQYTFNGVNLYHALQVKNRAAAAVKLSTNG